MKFGKILFLKKNKVKKYQPVVSKIGKYTYSAKNINIPYPNRVEIGSFVSISSNVTLGHGEHPVHYLSTSPYLYLNGLGFKTNNYPQFEIPDKNEKIIIENDVWIGEGVFVKNGVKICNGAVVGAHSVVTKDVPPYAIVAGVPAKIIRYRFDQNTIDTLLDLKWWELPDKIIKEIKFDDIDAAILYLRKIRNNETEVLN